MRGWSYLAARFGMSSFRKLSQIERATAPDKQTMSLVFAKGCVTKTFIIKISAIVHLGHPSMLTHVWSNYFWIVVHMVNTILLRLRFVECQLNFPNLLLDFFFQKRILFSLISISVNTFCLPVKSKIHTTAKTYLIIFSYIVIHCLLIKRNLV